MADDVVLRTEDIRVAFGGIVALDGVSIEARRGESVGLIGSNGAGKSTLMNVISGFQPATGRVELFGEDASALPPHARAELGVGRVFQDARLFGELTVWESVAVALEARSKSEFIPSALALPPARALERARRAQADDLVAYLGTDERAIARSGTAADATRPRAATSQQNGHSRRELSPSALQGWTRASLLAQAAELQVPGRSRLNKRELIDAILEKA
jgi:ABC-type branched-subunit amino acid transport system ATPase component